MSQDYYRTHKFANILNKITECMYAGVLWLLCCIPIITIGASTTAFYYVINKVVRHDRGYVGAEFWSSFKSNFKQSTIVWLILLVVYAIVGADYFILYQMNSNENKTMQIYVVLFIAMSVLVVAWTLFLFPYIARFANTTKRCMKNAALMMVLNIHWAIVLLVLFAAEVLLLFYWPVSILLLCGGYMFLNNLILEKVFKKYMSEEDLALEAERNQEYYN